MAQCSSSETQLILFQLVNISHQYYTMRGCYVANFKLLCVVTRNSSFLNHNRIKTHILYRILDI